MKVMTQRQGFAGCIALAFAACGGEATSNGANAGSDGAGVPSSNGGAQTTPSIEAGGGGAGVSNLAAAGSDEGGSVSAGGEAPDVGAPAAGGAHAEVTSAGANGEVAPGDATDGGATDGGAPDTVKPSGGTHVCEGAYDCSNPLECRGRRTSALKVCLAGCTADTECAASHRCVMPSDPLGPDRAACFLRCDDSPLVCPYAFDCYDISGQRDYTCLPRQW
jgi:hypothetical protein